MKKFNKKGMVVLNAVLMLGLILAIVGITAVMLSQHAGKSSVKAVKQAKSYDLIKIGLETLDWIHWIGYIAWQHGIGNMALATWQWQHFIEYVGLATLNWHLQRRISYTHPSD